MKKGTLLLAGILLLALAATYFALQRPGETNAPGVTGQMLVDYDSSSIDRLTVDGPGTAISIEKVTDGWMILAPVRFRADAKVVAEALGLGRRIGLGSLVSTNPQKQHLFQVDSAGTLVQFFRGGTRVTAFRVGKMGSTYRETYVRREGSEEVYLGLGLMGSPFTRQASEWRDKTILATDVNSLPWVVFRFGDTVFTVSRTPGGWVIGTDTAKAEAVASVVNGIADLRADGFVDTTVAVMPQASAVLEVPGARVTFYARQPGEPFFVRTSTTEQLFEMSGWRVSQVVKRKEEFLSHPSGPGAPGLLRK